MFTSVTHVSPSGCACPRRLSTMQLQPSLQPPLRVHGRSGQGVKTRLPAGGVGGNSSWCAWRLSAVPKSPARYKGWPLGVVIPVLLDLRARVAGACVFLPSGAKLVRTSELKGRECGLLNSGGTGAYRLQAPGECWRDVQMQFWMCGSG